MLGRYTTGPGSERKGYRKLRKRLGSGAGPIKSFSRISSGLYTDFLSNPPNTQIDSPCVADSGPISPQIRAW